MKIVLSLLAMGLTYSISISAAPAQCKESAQALTLRQHMVCMSYDLDNAFAEIGKSVSPAEAVKSLDQVRRHAQLALALEPSKAHGLKPEEMQVKAIEYQVALAETLATLGRLELRLMTYPANAGPISDDLKTTQLVMRLQQLIGEGHKRFR